MEFIQVFISEVAGGEHSLDIAAGKAYTKSLRKYHNWIVRGIFSVRSVITLKGSHPVYYITCRVNFRGGGSFCPSWNCLALP